MNGIADGFFKGYGLMDNHYRNEDAKDFRDQQYADQKKQRGLQNERQYEQDLRQKSMDSRSKESHEVNMTNAGLDTQIKTKQVADYAADKALDTKTKKQTLSNAQQTGKVRGLQITAAEKQAKEKEQQKVFYNVVNSIEGSKVGLPVDFAAISNQASTLKGTQYGFLFDSLQQESIRALGADIENGQISSNTLQLLNNGGMPELKKAVGKPSRFGSPIKDVAIVSLEPTSDAGDKFAIRLLVSDEAGNTYQSGVNETRDAGDSPLKELDADKVIQHLMAQNAILDEAEQSGFLDKLGQHQAMQMQQGKKVPASVQKYQYLDNLLGREGFKQWLTTSKDLSPQRMQFEASKIANEAVSNDMSLYNASPEEKQKAVNEIIQSLLSLPQEVEAQQQGGQQQPVKDPLAPQPDNNDPLGLGL